MADWSVEEAECIETAQLVAYHYSMYGHYECEVYAEYKCLPAANRKYVIDKLKGMGFLITSTELDDTLEFNWRCDNCWKFAKQCNVYAHEANNIEGEIEEILSEVKRMAARGEKYTVINLSSLGKVFVDIDPQTWKIRTRILDYQLAQEGYATVSLNGETYVTFRDRMWKL